MDEITYKIALGLLVFAMNGIRFYFQQRYKTTHAQKITERKPIRERLLVGIVTLSLAPPGLLWIFSDWLSFGQLPLPDGLRIVGFLIGVYAMYLFYVVQKQLGDNWSPVLETRQEHQLVVSGLYRYVRHPMYADMLLWIVSFGLLTANWFYLLTMASRMLTLFVMRIPDEEKLMIDQFGDQYRQYMKTTKRLIPYLF